LKIQKPAISSFASANGPSTTVRVLPLKYPRAPFELAWSPSPATITPAAASSSLYFCIAVSSSTLGILPASLSAFAFKRIMTRIVVSFWGAGPPAPVGIWRNVDRLGGESTPGDCRGNLLFAAVDSGGPVRRQATSLDAPKGRG
jgi:hypothetical protein